MVDTSRWHQAYYLLLVITYCVAKPLESTGPVSDNEATTTPCPEELKTQTTTVNEMLKEKEQTNDSLLYQSEAEHSHQDDDTRTFRREEQKQNSDSEFKPPGANKFEGKPHSTEENDHTTTMCPEESQKQKNEDKSNAIENKEKDISPTHSQVESEVQLKNIQDKKNTNVINDNSKKSVNSLNTLNVEHVGPIHKETESRFEDESDINAEDQNINAPHQSPTENSQYATTICPEELLKQQVLNANEKAEEEHNSETLAVQSEEERFQNQKDTNDQLPENIDGTTTICPEELAKHQEEAEETGGNEISVKTLLNVQKDSVLLKLVKKKFEADNSKPSDQVRRKRQTQNYSPYYSNQPSYNSQGIAVSTNDQRSVLPQQLDYNTRASGQQKYFQQPAAAYNVRTYQQIQRQHQNPYPKAYQNYVKPIKSYQNPSSYVRYPSNGNFNNLYKLKNGGNRRQYQASVRPKTSTSRSTRATSKKKFRPSPVFA